MELTKEEHTTIANTILQQLGGRRFITMTGAKDFTALSTSKNGGLQFGLKRTPGVKVNKVSITLNGRDLYDIKFMKFSTRTFHCEVLSSVEDVHVESLEEVFTEHTGLYTRF